ncbi:hypothetical protein NDU88_002759 [Pleurodeles waltl]|uniref:Uncharacterized protein n=1 Tax=Pleurodeles waltl TaxID=8319 RepID=A0AAV7MPT8_PLEWA|nr:hypothetical protein NDU88_002759 [Pleurodeles waltl]
MTNYLSRYTLNLRIEIPYCTLPVDTLDPLKKISQLDNLSGLGEIAQIRRITLRMARYYQFSQNKGQETEDTFLAMFLTEKEAIVLAVQECKVGHPVVLEAYPIVDSYSMKDCAKTEG